MGALPPSENPESTPTARPTPDGLRLSAGLRVGGSRFLLERQLGRGGMGVVWLAFDERLEEEVALKFLPPEIQHDPTALDDLLRETQRSRRLTHSNIIRIHDLFAGEGELPFISMEYVDGPTLSLVRIKRPARVLDWEYLAPLVGQLCEALQYAHDEQVVHRDLKPANVMVDVRSRVKLADFGIARVVTDSMSRVTLQPSMSGTMIYMSPQQLDGERSRPTDDLYSLGATLFELLTSKPPFYAGDVAHQIRYSQSPALTDRLGEFGITNDVPEPVEAAISSCLAKDPLQRPHCAREFADRCGVAASRPPTTVTRTALPPTQRLRPEAPGRPKRSWGWTVLLAALLMLAAFVAWNTSVLQHELELVRKGLLEPGQIPPIRRALAEAVGVDVDTLVAETAAPAKPPAEGPQPATAPTPMTTEGPAVPSLEPEPEAAPPAEPEAVAVPAYPQADRPWTNGLGMRFAAVPGLPAVLFSLWETRRQDYEAFCQGTGRREIPAAAAFEKQTGPLHPVVNVSWTDAQDFCLWLTQHEQEQHRLKPGQSYRLPADLEWSAAVGLPPEDQPTPSARNARILSMYPWGNTRTPTLNAGNYPGQEIPRQWDWYTIADYDDGHPYTAPVGTFQPNAAGLYDLGGNVWEWCVDSYNPYDTQETRVLRGAAWNTTDPRERLSSFRYALAPDLTQDNVGFRCVLAVEEQKPPE